MTHHNSTICWTTWISWRGIIAGVVTTFAVATVLHLLGIAFGFAMIEPTSDDPVSGVGAAFTIWSFISVLISLGAGGFAAGYATSSRGCAHGFLMWATVLLLGTVITGHAISLASRAVVTTAKGTASAVSGVAQGAGGLIGSTITGIQENVNLNFESEELSKDVLATLGDTGIETLQPAFLKKQMREARADLRTAVNQLLTDAQDYDGIIEKFLTTQKGRLDHITKNIDRDAAVKAVMEKKQIPKEEAEAMVDNALTVFNQVVHRAEETLTEAQQQLTEAKEHLRTLTAQAKVKAEKWAAAAAASALLAAVALILGAAVSSVAGHFGNRCAMRNSYMVHAPELIDD